ncbi:multidrug ABC transporter ATPase [Cryobacterium melibiosiphilum]|uniref:Multidrug ABC transporter ATPase n=1 Tax=Cryobacterium melibiosiphilum TaxID=995039 RepID=A0A3A5MIA7_9MICO|nr:multidrug ABC transporter ATPase [Cryobacterium melibiosiphilum]RJT86186.1 multidrug ABC transporter ATPase [Cryobacterium melibiosiphilum]
MTTQIPHAANRLERILAYMVAGVVGLSILCFLALIIGTSLGAGDNDGFSTGLWPFVITVPNFGLPLGFLLIIGLLVTSAIRRSREAKEQE